MVIHGHDEKLRDKESVDLNRGKDLEEDREEGAKPASEVPHNTYQRSALGNGNDNGNLRIGARRRSYVKQVPATN